MQVSSTTPGMLGVNLSLLWLFCVSFFCCALLGNLKQLPCFCIGSGNSIMIDASSFFFFPLDARVLFSKCWIQKILFSVRILREVVLYKLLPPSRQWAGFDNRMTYVAELSKLLSKQKIVDDRCIDTHSVLFARNYARTGILLTNQVIAEFAKI